MGNMHKMRVWQDAKLLATQIYHITNNNAFAKDYSFRDQLRRSAISVPSNLAEGEESLFPKVSIKFFSVASASLAELRTQIEIARDISYLEESKYLEISNATEVLAKRIKKLIQYRYNQLKYPSP